MARGAEWRGSPKQKRHIPQLALLFSFPACHGAPSIQESTRQTHTHINKCQCSPSAGAHNCLGKQDAFRLLLYHQNGTKTHKVRPTRQSTACDSKCCGDRQHTPPQHALAFQFMLMDLRQPIMHTLSNFFSFLFLHFLCKSTERSAPVRRKSLQGAFTQTRTRHRERQRGTMEK